MGRTTQRKVGWTVQCLDPKKHPENSAPSTSSGTGVETPAVTAAKFDKGSNSEPIHNFFPACS